MRVPHLPLVIALSVIAAAAQAQTLTGNPMTGQQLYQNTGTASGNGSLASCTSCHGAVEARRSTISVNTGGAADPYADISFDTAMTRLTQALQSQRPWRHSAC